MADFDVIVIGSGTAGQTAAYELKAAGLKVAVAEKSNRPGGTCALRGCQPKKWFYEVTETIARSRHLQGKGIDMAPWASWSSIREQKNKFTSEVPGNTINGLKDAGIVFLSGNARFVSESRLEVGGNPVSADYFVLATGAKPMPLPIRGSDNILTSDDFLELNELPERLLFIGGGFISFEFAHFAARLGPPNSRITILEAAERPLGPFDAEMVALLVEASREAEIEVLTSTQIEAVEKTPGGYHVLSSGGKSYTADLVVHGAGRAPQLEVLDLETGGVSYSRQGIAVDQRMRTSNPRVFAVGDCAATIQLARVADFEAHVAAQNIFAAIQGTGEDAAISYQAVPVMLFTYPQYAMVGQTEAALKKEGVSYRKAFAKNLQWPTYQRVGLAHAAYKILVGADNRILAAHLLSDNASGMINTLKHAMINNLTVEDLYRQSILSPYPSRESDLIYMLKPLLR